VTTQRLAPQPKARLAKLQRLLARVKARGVRSATPTGTATATARQVPAVATAGPKPTGIAARLPAAAPRVERPATPPRPQPSAQLVPTPPPALVSPPPEEQLVTPHEAKALDDLFASDHGESEDEQVVTRVVPVEQLLAESLAASLVPEAEAPDIFAGRTSTSSAPSASQPAGALDSPSRDGAAEREPSVVAGDEAEASRPITRPVAAPSRRVSPAVCLIAIALVAALAFANYRFFLPL
jgi:hypothetical protein